MTTVAPPGGQSLPHRSHSYYDPQHDQQQQQRPLINGDDVDHHRRFLEAERVHIEDNNERMERILAAFKMVEEERRALQEDMQALQDHYGASAINDDDQVTYEVEYDAMTRRKDELDAQRLSLRSEIAELRSWHQTMLEQVMEEQRKQQQAVVATTTTATKKKSTSKTRRSTSTGDTNAATVGARTGRVSATRSTSTTKKSKTASSSTVKRTTSQQKTQESSRPVSRSRTPRTTTPSKPRAVAQPHTPQPTTAGQRRTLSGAQRAAIEPDRRPRSSGGAMQRRNEGLFADARAPHQHRGTAMPTTRAVMHPDAPQWGATRAHRPGTAGPVLGHPRNRKEPDDAWSALPPAKNDLLFEPPTYTRTAPAPVAPVTARSRKASPPKSERPALRQLEKLLHHTASAEGFAPSLNTDQKTTVERLILEAQREAQTAHETNVRLQLLERERELEIHRLRAKAATKENNFITDRSSSPTRSNTTDSRRNTDTAIRSISFAVNLAESQKRYHIMKVEDMERLDLLKNFAEEPLRSMSNSPRRSHSMGEPQQSNAATSPSRSTFSATESPLKQTLGTHHVAGNVKSTPDKIEERHHRVATTAQSQHTMAAHHFSVDTREIQPLEPINEQNEEASATLPVPPLQMVLEEQTQQTFDIKSAIQQQIANEHDIEAEAKRIAEEKRLAEEAEAKRIAEEKRLAEEAEAKRIAEEKRLAEEAEAKRIAEEKRLAEEAEAKRMSALEGDDDDEAVAEEACVFGDAVESLLTQWVSEALVAHSNDNRRIEPLAVKSEEMAVLDDDVEAVESEAATFAEATANLVDTWVASSVWVAKKREKDRQEGVPSGQAKEMPAELEAAIRAAQGKVPQVDVSKPGDNEPIADAVDADDESVEDEAQVFVEAVEQLLNNWIAGAAACSPNSISNNTSPNTSITGASIGLLGSENAASSANDADFLSPDKTFPVAEPLASLDGDDVPIMRPRHHRNTVSIEDDRPEADTVGSSTNVAAEEDNVSPIKMSALPPVDPSLPPPPPSAAPKDRPKSSVETATTIVDAVILGDYAKIVPREVTATAALMLQDLVSRAKRDKELIAADAELYGTTVRGTPSSSSHHPETITPVNPERFRADLMVYVTEAIEKHANKEAVPLKQHWGTKDAEQRERKKKILSASHANNTAAATVGADANVLSPTLSPDDDDGGTVFKGVATPDHFRKTVTKSSRTVVELALLDGVVDSIFNECVMDAVGWAASQTPQWLKNSEENLAGH